MIREIDGFLQSHWLAALRCAFDAVDQDGDGEVTAEDLELALERFGFPVTSEWAVAQVARFDRSGDGKVTFPDYVAELVLARAEVDPAASSLLVAFDEVDSDHDGGITAGELAELYRERGSRLSVSQLADRVQAHDHDGDGRIDLGELVRMLLR